MKRTPALLLAGATVIALAACGTAGGATNEDGTQDLSLAFAAAVPDVQEFFLYAVPQELGYYEDEGLNVTMSQTGSGGSTAAIQTVVSGTVDVANSVAPSTIAAIDKGAPVQAFARIQEQWTWHTVVNPDSPIQSLADLEGKKIGVVSLASIAYPYARGALEVSGVNPDDAEYVPTGSGVPAFQALKDGDVDAVTYWTAGLVTAEGAGFEFRELENPDYFDAMPASMWVAKTSALEEDPEKFAAFARAQYKGVVFALVNPEATVEIGYKHFPDLMPSEEDYDEQFANDLAALKAEVSEQVQNSEDSSTWTDFGAVSPEEWDTAIEFTIKSGEINEAPAADKLWTGALLDTINKDLDMAPVIEDAENYEG